MNKLYHLIVFFTLFFLNSVVAQTETNSEEKSNIQNYTPSKLLEKGKIDIKWFNNLYTQTRSESNGVKSDVLRSTFFTTSLEVFTGVSNNKKINAGLIVEYRSNSFNGQSTTSVFKFKNKEAISRNGLSHFAPSVKIAPFSKWNNFSIQSSFFIPLFKNEINGDGYLGNNSYIWQNRFFYDYTFSSKKFQLFTELGTRFFFGKEGEGYANTSLELAPGIFLSYFPTQKFTVLTFVQHAQLLDLGNNFEQNYSTIGAGAKYQLTKTLHLETLYSKFVRGNDSGLGQSFNFGLRAIF